jgi:hypothetical protein
MFSARAMLQLLEEVKDYISKVNLLLIALKASLRATSRDFYAGASGGGLDARTWPRCGVSNSEE